MSCRTFVPALDVSTLDRVSKDPVTIKKCNSKMTARNDEVLTDWNISDNLNFYGYFMSNSQIYIDCYTNSWSKKIRKNRSVSLDKKSVADKALGANFSVVLSEFSHNLLDNDCTA